MAAAISHDGRKELFQHLGACILMVTVLGIVHREGAKLAGEMAYVMQQRADDDLFGLAVALGDRGTLQHVFAHRHGLAKVFIAAAPIKDRADEGNDVLCRQIVDIRFIPASKTAARIIA